MQDTTSLEWKIPTLNLRTNLQSPLNTGGSSNSDYTNADESAFITCVLSQIPLSNRPFLLCKAVTPPTVERHSPSSHSQQFLSPGGSVSISQLGSTFIIHALYLLMVLATHTTVTHLGILLIVGGPTPGDHPYPPLHTTVSSLFTRNSTHNCICNYFHIWNVTML